MSCCKPQGSAAGIIGTHLNIFLALLRYNPGQIIGTGEATGHHHRDNSVVPVLHDLLDHLSHLLRGGQRGLGQLSRMQTGIDIHITDIHAILILAVFT